MLSMSELAQGPKHTQLQTLEQSVTNSFTRFNSRFEQTLAVPIYRSIAQKFCHDQEFTGNGAE